MAFSTWAGCCVHQRAPGCQVALGAASAIKQEPEWPCWPCVCCHWHRHTPSSSYHPESTPSLSLSRTRLELTLPLPSVLQPNDKACTAGESPCFSGSGNEEGNPQIRHLRPSTWHHPVSPSPARTRSPGAREMLGRESCRIPWAARARGTSECADLPRRTASLMFFKHWELGGL